MKPITETVKIELENMVDAYGLAEMLSTLAEIAGEKAEHIRVNWQDEKLAKCWNRAGESVLNAAGKAFDYIG